MKTSFLYDKFIFLQDYQTMYQVIGCHCYPSTFSGNYSVEVRSQTTSLSDVSYLRSKTLFFA